MELQPLNDLIQVKPINLSQNLPSGLVLPESKERSTQAEVVAVGLGRRTKSGERIPNEVQVGDIVLLAKYAGHEIRVGSETHLIIHEDDILAVVG